MAVAFFVLRHGSHIICSHNLKFVDLVYVTRFSCYTVNEIARTKTEQSLRKILFKFLSVSRRVKKRILFQKYIRGI